MSELPHSPQSKTLPYRQGHILAHSWGTGEKIVYLVHGWESNAGRMKSFIQPLIESGFKVVVFDMPSHGHSSKQITHLRDFSSALELVISAYGQPFGILAHSFGGTATVILLSEKKQFTPEKLCLISPMKSLESHFDVFNAIANLPESIMNRLALILKARYALESNKTDITQLIKRLSNPGLLIHDENDSLISIDVAKSVANSWDGSRFIKTYDLGHRKILKDPEVIREVTDYILDQPTV